MSNHVGPTCLNHILCTLLAFSHNYFSPFLTFSLIPNSIITDLNTPLAHSVTSLTSLRRGSVLGMVGHCRGWESFYRRLRSELWEKHITGIIYRLRNGRTSSSDSLHFFTREASLIKKKERKKMCNSLVNTFKNANIYIPGPPIMGFEMFLKIYLVWMQ